jgi:hypothetical protein
MGRLAAVAQVVMAGLIGAVAAIAGAASGEHVPEPLPRGVTLALLYLIPAAVGVIGAGGQRRSLLGAAAALCVLGSFLSFVTLIFLIPAILFGAAAASRIDGATSDRTVGRLGSLVGEALGLAIVGFGVASALALLLTTTDACWSTATGSGCGSGVITIQGLALAAVFGAGAIGLARLSVVLDRSIRGPREPA